MPEIVRVDGSIGKTTKRSKLYRRLLKKIAHYFSHALVNLLFDGDQRSRNR